METSTCHSGSATKGKKTTRHHGDQTNKKRLIIFASGPKPTNFNRNRTSVGVGRLLRWAVHMSTTCTARATGAHSWQACPNHPHHPFEDNGQVGHGTTAPSFITDSGQLPNCCAYRQFTRSYPLNMSRYGYDDSAIQVTISGTPLDSWR